MAGSESPFPCCNDPSYWIVGSIVCMLWVVELVMVMMDGTQEADGDVDGAEGDDLEIARLLSTEFEVGGGEGLDALVLRASIPAAQFKRIFDWTLPN